MFTLSPPGAAGPLVICSDCYDNANIYSRTREYCPYAYLGEDDPLDKTLPGLKDGFAERGQRGDPTLESFISNQNPSVFLASHEGRFSSHPPPEHYANGEARRQKFHFYLGEHDGDTNLSPAADITPAFLKCFQRPAATGWTAHISLRSECSFHRTVLPPQVLLACPSGEKKGKIHPPQPREVLPITL